MTRTIPGCMRCFMCRNLDFMKQTVKDQVGRAFALNVTRHVILSAAKELSEKEMLRPPASD